MMQMCPYLQARYHYLQGYLCPLVQLVLEFRTHEVLAFWQMGLYGNMVRVLVTYTCKFHADEMSKQVPQGFINVRHVKIYIFKTH